VLQRPLSKRMSFLDFFVHMYGFSAVFALIVTLIPRENYVTDQLFFNRLGPLGWVAIFVGSVVQCFLNFLLVAFVTNFIGSSLIVSLFRASAPVLIVIESIVLLDEQLDQYQVYGGLLIILGVLFTLMPVILQPSDNVARSSNNTNDESTSTTQNDSELQTPATEERIVVVSQDSFTFAAAERSAEIK
jgi:drug/metabolite transporter (DMT)-like permease